MTPTITAETPTSVVRSRYTRHATRAGVLREAEYQNAATGNLAEALRCAAGWQESARYAAECREVLAARGVTV